VSPVARLNASRIIFLVGQTFRPLGVAYVRQRPDAALRDREQISTVHPGRRAARELEPLGPLVAAGGDPLLFSLRPKLG